MLMKGLATVAVTQMTSLHLVDIWGNATPQSQDINGVLDNINTVVETEQNVFADL